MEEDFYQVLLKAILKNQKGEILALKADPPGSFDGFYDLPGGRINTDEFDVPFTEVLAREVREEIGAAAARPRIFSSGVDSG